MKTDSIGDNISNSKIFLIKKGRPPGTIHSWHKGHVSMQGRVCPKAKSCNICSLSRLCMSVCMYVCMHLCMYVCIVLLDLVVGHNLPCMDTCPLC